jgi:hypothetical protein
VYRGCRRSVAARLREVGLDKAVEGFLAEDHVRRRLVRGRDRVPDEHPIVAGVCNKESAILQPDALRPFQALAVGLKPVETALFMSAWPKTMSAGCPFRVGMLFQMSTLLLSARSAMARRTPSARNAARKAQAVRRCHLQVVISEVGLPEHEICLPDAHQAFIDDRKLLKRAWELLRDVL